MPSYLSVDGEYQHFQNQIFTGTIMCSKYGHGNDHPDIKFCLNHTFKNAFHNNLQTF